MRLHRRLLALCAATILATATAAFADTGVVGDDESDSYVGTGALLLARTWTGTSRDRAVLSRCAGCRWVVVRSCRGDHALCHWEQLPACPAGTVRFDVSFAASATSALNFKGTTCIGAGGPPTAKRVSEQVHQIAVARLPNLAPRHLAAVAVTGTSSTVTSGAPTAVTFDLRVLGQPVQIKATALIAWNWSDGISMHTSLPAVTRTWSRPGRVVGTTRASWSARYTVDGLGPFAVAQKIHQEADTSVLVLRARAVLVPLP